jgi:hypothetical protein
VVEKGYMRVGDRDETRYRLSGEREKKYQGVLRSHRGAAEPDRDQRIQMCLIPSFIHHVTSYSSRAGSFTHGSITRPSSLRLPHARCNSTHLRQLSSALATRPQELLSLISTTRGLDTRCSELPRPRVSALACPSAVGCWLIAPFTFHLHEIMMAPAGRLMFDTFFRSRHCQAP